MSSQRDLVRHLCDAGRVLRNLARKAQAPRTRAIWNAHASTCYTAATVLQAHQKAQAGASQKGATC